MENGIGEMQALVSGSNIEWGPLCTDGYTVGTVPTDGCWMGAPPIYCSKMYDLEIVERKVAIDLCLLSDVVSSWTKLRR